MGVGGRKKIEDFYSFWCVSHSVSIIICSGKAIFTCFSCVDCQNKSYLMKSITTIFSWLVRKTSFSWRGCLFLVTTWLFDKNDKKKCFLGHLQSKQLFIFILIWMIHAAHYMSVAWFLISTYTFFTCTDSSFHRFLVTQGNRRFEAHSKLLWVIITCKLVKFLAVNYELVSDRSFLSDPLTSSFTPRFSRRLMSCWLCSMFK